MDHPIDPVILDALRPPTKSENHLLARRRASVGDIICVTQRQMAPLKTRGFLNTRQLNRHFSEHGADLGASNANDYEQSADGFLGSTLPSGVHECKRKQGDTIRYDPQTQEYGVLDSKGIIRTYFKPVPCSSLRASVRAAVRQAGRCHGHANNFLYFQSECKRW